MENMNLFELMGIEIPDEKEKKEIKKETKTKGKASTTDVSFSTKNNIKLIFGYYPSKTLTKDDFDGKETVTEKDVFEKIKTFFCEYHEDLFLLKDVSSNKVDGEVVLQLQHNLKAKRYVAAASKEEDEDTEEESQKRTLLLRGSDFEFETEEGESVEGLQEAFSTYPQYKECKFYSAEDDERILVVPLPKEGFYWDSPFFLHYASLEVEYSQEDCQRICGKTEKLDKKDLDKLIKDAFPKDVLPLKATGCVNGHVYLFAAGIGTTPKDTSKPKETLYPTKEGTFLSLVYERIALNPALFGGKDKVGAKELIAFLQERGNFEFKKERTSFTYDKESKFIIATIAGAKKG